MASLSAETSTKLGLIARDSRTPSPFSWEGKAARYRGGLRGDLESFGKKWKTLDARSRKMRSRGNSGEELSGFETRPNGGRMWWAEKVCGLVS